MTSDRYHRAKFEALMGEQYRLRAAAHRNGWGDTYALPMLREAWTVWCAAIDAVSVPLWHCEPDGVDTTLVLTVAGREYRQRFAYYKLASGAHVRLETAIERLKQRAGVA